MFQRKTALCSPLVKRTFQLLTVVLVLAAALSLFNTTASAKTDYEIHVGNNVYHHSTNTTDPSQVLREAGISHSETDLLRTSNKGQVVSLSVTRRQYVTVNVDGVQSSKLVDPNETVAQALDRLNIKVSEYDLVSPALDELIGSRTATIRIQRAAVSYTTETTTIPYSTIYDPDTTLERGIQQKTASGKDGSSTITYRVIEVEGQEPRREALHISTVNPENEVYTYGTKTNFERPSGYSTSSTYITNIDDIQGTFTTSEGETYSFSETLTLDATAYTAKAGAICSTGRLARVGVVAVDPKYIPYGTEMFIMSADGSFVYGLAVAGDCGGAIDDWDVDLYMTSRDRCINFGRQDVVAYVIEPDSTDPV